ncbi:MAG: hypothetical protein QM305_10670 [Bacteroidota bacterium]|jgi:hypothetical protein|nr:hypothetical protein [Bacteroidota bacterium]MDI9605762.1 hypothetical protein [Bacteroidota bacterium]HHU27039.1 hypothetical protein [Bacteroidales bacterium]
MTERIVLEVDSDIAKKWRVSSKERKQKISQSINIKLAEELSETREEFLRYLDELGKSMEERGLTEEILREILQ